MTGIEGGVTEIFMYVVTTRCTLLSSDNKLLNIFFLPVLLFFIEGGGGVYRRL